jgi:hypothetical protein
MKIHLKIDEGADFEPDGVNEGRIEAARGLCGLFDFFEVTNAKMKLTAQALTAVVGTEQRHHDERQR